MGTLWNESDNEARDFTRDVAFGLHSLSAIVALYRRQGRPHRVGHYLRPDFFRHPNALREGIAVGRLTPEEDQVFDDRRSDVVSLDQVEKREVLKAFLSAQGLRA